MQSLMGLLQFVASVSPPPLESSPTGCWRISEKHPRGGTESLSLGFKKDLSFFRELWPAYNGVRILIKKDIECQGELELDACTTGCGAFIGEQYYSEQFPAPVLGAQHPIARLELLNIVVAVKTWADVWSHQRVKIRCDNMNACLAVRSGRSRDPCMQKCVRELFAVCVVHDIELHATHCPGELMQRADALSRAHTGQVYRDRMAADERLGRARQVRIPVGHFMLINDM